MAQATARHILVETEEECLSLKEQIENGLDFAEAAKNNSSCPSGGKGGDLGSFAPGQLFPSITLKPFISISFSHKTGGTTKTIWALEDIWFNTS